MNIITHVFWYTYTYAFLLGTHIGLTLLGQRKVMKLALVDIAKQVCNLVVSNMNILNYFPVELKPDLVIAGHEKSMSI